ncbi:MAG: Ig-like domain repeat protein, partial [Thermoanaerobaculia bacterium]
AGLTLTSSLNPSTTNDDPTVTGTIVPPPAVAPTGTLTLKRGDTVIGTRDLSTGLSLSAILSDLAVGSYPITALYSGDARFRPETRTLTQVVTLPPFGMPMNLVANSTGGPVQVSWVGTQGVAHYEVWRAGGGAGWALLTTTANQSLIDSTASPSAAWIYKVRGISSEPGSTPSAFSNSDLASTYSFTDETITAASTRIKLAHLSQLRDAINAARIAAGLGLFPWSEPSPILVKAGHWNELKLALDAVRSNLGMPAAVYSAPHPATGVKVRGAIVTELRANVR